DYGDGGAFPEVHVVQYPLDMGRKRTGSNNTNKAETLPLQTDAQGNVRYDMILHSAGGARQEGKIIQSQLKDLKPMDIKEGYDPALARPDEETVKDITEKTRLALEKIVDSKIKASQPKQVTEKAKGPTYIRYTPSNQSAVHNAGASTRIIRMVEAPVDPFEPPRFKHKKVPRGPPSPPAPVMHSPPRKVSAEEQKNWVIPPCISNWKNAKGYTIPLDKRLAADGRGVQEVVVNDNFAKLSEALLIADRHAREEVRIRAEMQSKLAAKEKKEKEEKLRMLAQKAREERAGIVSSSSGGRAAGAAPGSDSESDEEEERGGRGGVDEDLTEEEMAAIREREEIRREKQRQRERELRMSHMGAETKAKVMAKTGERDISEKIALGVAQPKLSKESMFDSRLFNQSSGISSGFGKEDSYNIYDKPLFAGSSSAQIYRPRKAEEDVVGGVRTDAIDKILGGSAPHRGFKGAEGGSGAARDGPVLFEKDESDPFGLEQFMTSAKRGREKMDERMKDRGTMHAAVSGKREDYDTGRGSSSSRKIEFQSSSSSSSSRYDERDSKRSRRD
ncbi:SNW domain-containing protein 1, partial [Quaeritorhiza haematococci]